MILDKIIYDEETILEIYHNGFDKFNCDRNICKEEQIQNKMLRFEEKYVKNCIINEQMYYIESGLVDCKHIFNPYAERASAIIKHYINKKKPNILFNNQEEEISLKIPIELLNMIDNFVEKYMGIKISEYPALYGDVIICTPYEYSFCEIKNGGGLIIENPPINTEIFVMFINDNDIVVCAKKIYINSKVDKKKILCEPHYEYIYICIYEFEEESDEAIKNIKMVYRYKELCFMRSLNYNLEISGGKSKEIPVSKIAGDCKYINYPEAKSKWEFKIPEKSKNEYVDKLMILNMQIRNMKRKSPYVGYKLINRGDADNVIDMLINEFSNAEDKIWIFDSYFVDLEDKKSIMIDYLRILYQSKCSEVNIVFYISRRNFDAIEDDQIRVEQEKYFADLKNIINNDPEISSYKKNSKIPKLKMIITKKPIHDRYVFTESKGVVNGMTIGTSFNSFKDNIFSIIRLNDEDAKMTLNILKEEMDGEYIEI